ncbi:hypothetical protein Ae201684_009764 [Aphanomyces euteiches]|uniref:Uncharacterized protein n=1 Tax=Aphanomyces euteiches TaxID=100861 RepID=A0A6G0X180_9STRA|nr:hypothetical protein Ae201684_009764 [Aphanomyces euteiches]
MQSMLHCIWQGAPALLSLRNTDGTALLLCTNKDGEAGSSYPAMLDAGLLTVLLMGRPFLLSLLLPLLRVVLALAIAGFLSSQYMPDLSSEMHFPLVCQFRYATDALTDILKVRHLAIVARSSTTLSMGDKKSNDRPAFMARLGRFCFA